MIHSALQIIRGELNEYLENGQPQDIVVLENISQLDNTGSSNAANMDGKVVMTLVNMAEESTLRNGRTTAIRPNQVTYQNNPVFLNLFVLFVMNFQDYNSALQKLSQVVQFFQGKRVFNQLNSPGAAAQFSNGEQFKLILDMFEIGYEDLNNLWGILGGKQIPSVMYRMRLVELKRDQLLDTGGFITDIQLNENLDFPSS